MTKRKMKQFIMITRPAHQAGPLAKGIKAAGGEAFLFPTLKHTKIKLHWKWQKKPSKKPDWAVFLIK